MKEIIKTISAIDKVIVWLILPIMAFGLGVSAITGKSLVIEPVGNENTGWALVVCGVGIFIIESVVWARKAITWVGSARGNGSGFNKPR
jgi:hypothetical protein